MPKENILQHIKNAEQKFKENNYKGSSTRPCMVEKYGDLPILLSAPHAVKQIRNCEIKAHEFYTGAIVECLAKQIGCACITKQYLIENTANDDPNTDNANCSYKTAIKQFLQKYNIKLFVDIHGLSSKRDSVVDICIDKGKNVNNMAYVHELQKCIESQFGKNRLYLPLWRYIRQAPLYMLDIIVLLLMAVCSEMAEFEFIDNEVFEESCETILYLAWLNCIYRYRQLKI